MPASGGSGPAPRRRLLLTLLLAAGPWIAVETIVAKRLDRQAHDHAHHDPRRLPPSGRGRARRLSARGQPHPPTAGEPNSPPHYLGMLGVRNDHQGQGLGRSLVEHIKSFVRLDPDSTRICLNTETDANVPIYERLGFTVIHESGIDDVHTRCMFWKSD